MTLLDSTVVENAAWNGFSVRVQSWSSQGTGACVAGDCRLVNTIVWGGHFALSFESGVAEAQVDHSCIEGETVLPGEGNLRADPLFVRSGVWEENASSDPSDDVWTPGDYHLQAGSPCRDAGACEGAPPVDLDGNARPADGVHCAVGAYELVPPPMPARFLRGDVNGDAAIDISAAIAALGFLFLGAETLPCAKAADANGDGLVDISDAAFLLSFLFLGGKAPQEPFGSCGVDPLPDELRCKRDPGCR